MYKKNMCAVAYTCFTGIYNNYIYVIYIYKFEYINDYKYT